MRIDPPDRKRLVTFEEMKKTLRAKYGSPAFETKLEMQPEELYRLVQSGRANLETVWKVGTTHSVSCKLVQGGGEVIIRLTYQDDTLNAQVQSRQENDI